MPTQGPYTPQDPAASSSRPFHQTSLICWLLASTRWKCAQAASAECWVRVDPSQMTLGMSTMEFCNVCRPVISLSVRYGLWSSVSSKTRTLTGHWLKWIEDKSSRIGSKPGQRSRLSTWAPISLWSAGINQKIITSSTKVICPYWTKLSNLEGRPVSRKEKFHPLKLVSTCLSLSVRPLNS